MKFPSLWLTEYERSGFVRSPRYKESITYFKQFESKTRYAKMIRIGVSPQGRPIECLIVAKGKEFTSAKAINSGKAVVLIQNGIHAGEIEGKDACMLLLRDILITKEKFHLLKNLILIVIPILNVDGHERISEYNRPNQNGPIEMGWRTNSHNLNLNRDYMKADSSEIRSFLRLFNDWLPDFFIDNHTTNGADYQYHITYALEKSVNMDAHLSNWGKEIFLPPLITAVESDGFLTAPYIQFKNSTIESGIIDSHAIPRLSTGYTAVQNRLGLLVETHSLKPYENRVRSTFSMNVAALEILNEQFRSLKSVNKKADKISKTIGSVPIRIELKDRANSFNFKGFKSLYEQSPITGTNVVRYSTEPITQKIPIYDLLEITRSIEVPRGYLIPKEFGTIVEILSLHGIIVEQLNQKKKITVEEYSFQDIHFLQKPYEGRMCANVRCSSEQKKITFPIGTFLVKTNQRTNRVIVNLLEPEAPDSFVSWGFFHSFFERKEYAEAYVMEPIARTMLENNEQLRSEFMTMLNDEHFRNDPEARLDFFYQRSPYFDSKEKIYPIYRMI
ncbi:MAG: M14 family metallopeptidase [Bacteroidetes bacterium]|nr:M14 family metallopeptidase [Bacteroidota bacterium]